MEREQNQHRRDALETLTYNESRSHSFDIRPPQNEAPDARADGKDAISARHTINESSDTRFSPVDLDQTPSSAPISNPRRLQNPWSMGGELPNNGGHNPWSSRDADAESRYSTQTVVLEEEGRSSRTFSKPFTFWERLKGRGRQRIGWWESLKAIATFSWLNFFLVFVPIAWAAHFSSTSHVIKFILCFIAIIPLSKLLDYGGEQLALYCGRVLGDLIVITLNNAVETALALVLLSRCDLKLLQSTVIGVVLLRLLLVPGSAFLAGGARVLTQELHPHVVQLNNTLLTTGALTLLLPSIFFGTLDRGSPNVVAAVSDSVRGDVLKISRALAIFLLAVYICSRFYLHKPPGDTDDLKDHPNAPESFKVDVAKLEQEEPALNPWVCIVMLVITVTLLGFTTEFLVHSVRPVRRVLDLKEEWFGLVLLPLVSYSADGILSTVYFIRHTFRHYLGMPSPPCILAQSRSIDLGIQFLIFWMPLVVLFGWFSHKPMSLLFDLFEVATLLGACFLVNYVTADAKTNWAEGMMMVTFYLMIVVTIWFYPGQMEVRQMLACSSVDS